MNIPEWNHCEEEGYPLQLFGDYEPPSNSNTDTES